MVLNGSEELTQPKLWIGTRVLIGLESKQNGITHLPKLTKPNLRFFLEKSIFMQL